MSANIVVPEVGESIVEARVARWMKKVGDAIALGDPLVELETDKVNLEVPAPAAGVLSRIDHQDGADVKIGEVLGVIDESGAAAPAGKPARLLRPHRRRPLRRADADKTRATPTAKKAAEQNDVNLASVKGNGRRRTRDEERCRTGREGQRPCRPAVGSAFRAGRSSASPARAAGDRSEERVGCRSGARPSRAGSSRRRAPPRCSAPSTKSTCRR
jgi:2-oxoglutarate dehydrogenase E2 component (dihydrolipoamide succinyltransferase)